MRGMLLGVVVAWTAAAHADPDHAASVRIAPNVIFDEVRGHYVIANGTLEAVDGFGKTAWSVPDAGRQVSLAGGALAVVHRKGADFTAQVVDLYDPADGRPVASCAFAIPNATHATAEANVFELHGQTYAVWLRHALPMPMGGVAPDPQEIAARRKVVKEALACGVMRLAPRGRTCKVTPVGFAAVGMRPCSEKRPYLEPSPEPRVDPMTMHVGIEQRDSGSTTSVRKSELFLVVRDDRGQERWRRVIGARQQVTAAPPIPATPPPSGGTPPPPVIPSGKGVVFGDVGANHNAHLFSEIPNHPIKIRGPQNLTVRTDARGRYSVELPPGKYVFETTVPTQPPGLSGTTTAKVEVVAGKRIEIVFRFSDGTRCLDRDTQISTPGGDVAVHALAPGDPIWACGADGSPFVDRIVATQIVDAPGLAVRVTVGAGALVLAPAHLLADGQRPDELPHARVHYSDRRSYDVLTATGRPYWAGGVALWSSMAAAGAPVSCGAPPRLAHE